eukprot:360229-Hanusia_phi.AAC.1
MVVARDMRIVELELDGNRCGGIHRSQRKLNCNVVPVGVSLVDLPGRCNKEVASIGNCRKRLAWYAHVADDESEVCAERSDGV